MTKAGQGWFYGLSAPPPHTGSEKKETQTSKETQIWKKRPKLKKRYPSLRKDPPNSLERPETQKRPKRYEKTEIIGLFCSLGLFYTTFFGKIYL